MGFLISLLSNKALTWANPLRENNKPDLKDVLKDEIGTRDLPNEQSLLFSYLFPDSD